MSRKRQFSGVTKPRTHYDRKVRVEGYTRSISLGKVIPKDWKYVRIYVYEKTEDSVRLWIKKLLGEEANAQTKTTR